jgi:hypothetical protein
MNLFRSEEHVRQWAKYDPETAGGILPLKDLVRLFSGNLFKRRLDFDYVSCSPNYLNEWLAEIKEVTQGRPFWSPVPL